MPGSRRGYCGTIGYSARHKEVRPRLLLLLYLHFKPRNSGLGSAGLQRLLRYLLGFIDINHLAAKQSVESIQHFLLWQPQDGALSP
jgi:hypothetical protein